MLEKLLEEIEEKIRLKRTVWDSLEKPPYNDFEQSLWITGMRNAKEIICKHMNDGWIPVEERLPEGETNPITQDFFWYQVTVNLNGHTDVRHYKFGGGHWWLGPMKMDKYVTAWRERPEPYRPEKQGEQNN